MMSQRISNLWLSFTVIWLMSCINTSYSRFDEVEITGNELDLVLGQFAHHGPRFYEREVTRTKALLAENENDFVARNDLASAHIKLMEYEQAVAEFDENEKRHPGRYETAANRGVLYKKMGKYQLAAKYLAQSLEIKKEGHMGLGDYYLRMIRWLDAVDKDPSYDKNFLGIKYSKSPKQTAQNPVINKEYLLTLIKNDYSFPDVYIVLGDVYFNEGEYQLAIRCYHRAQLLGHHRHSLARYRLREVAKKLNSIKSADQLVENDHAATHYNQVEGEIQAAQHWLLDFQTIEAELIDAGKPVDFKSMKQELKARGISKPKLKEAMIYKGEEEDETATQFRTYIVDGGSLTKLALLGVAAVVLILVLILFMRKSLK